jgi:hypothetical protein
MKILIISNKAYPAQGPRAFRTTELAEQLVKMGHEVVLYTVHGKYDYTEYERTTGVRRRDIKPRFATSANDDTHRYNIFDKFMYHYFNRLLLWPLCEFHFSVERIIKECPNMDMLITIAYPHSIHSGAARAKKKHPDIFPKTWICDCGDPFMLNPFFNFPKYMKRFEDMWCSMCDYITVPTEESRKGYYEQYWDKIRVIPQGFDFSKTPVADYRKNEVPTFLFVGSIYPGIRDPHAFMDYLLTLRRPYRFIMMMRSPLEDRYVKESGGQIQYVVGKGRKDVVWECSKADFLINVMNPSTVQTPSKLIDYGIAGRPVLDVANGFSDPTQFLKFYEGDYSGAHKIDFLDRYRIENVARQFMELAKQ